MGLINRLIKQGSNPKGRLGRIIAKGLNKHHAKIASWGLSHLQVNIEDTILDIGCGGGRDVKVLAEIVINGKIYGIDISEESVKVAKHTNKEFIEIGRVKILKASVSSLPFEKHTFDLITGIETYSFWPDFSNDLKEIYRALKPGGTLALIQGDYISENEIHRRKSEKWARRGNFHIFSPEEIQNFFKQSAYSNIEVIEEKEKGWLIVIGKKPACKAIGELVPLESSQGILT